MDIAGHAFAPNTRIYMTAQQTTAVAASAFVNVATSGTAFMIPKGSAFRPIVGSVASAGCQLAADQGFLTASSISLWIADSTGSPLLCVAANYPTQSMSTASQPANVVAADFILQSDLQAAGGDGTHFNLQAKINVKNSDGAAAHNVVTTLNAVIEVWTSVPDQSQVLGFRG